ncbi:MAG: toll/interleukin-1 receptor domain-containing protein [Candidatus Accumulibacter sp.]|uniref:toll/interleukin-1 receptor domain-containing protein n=1 Tax=Accumulibacter sp. TaxID=2053492 RepID=UPI001A53C957|nr:toll/interleukin-1 receptor domain-containing protein [Accumulibacter sp.]MBL8394837.1 toll/interleukin-1 receptor domain-containing protein [Accumulibacter sp.]
MRMIDRLLVVRRRGDGQTASIELLAGDLAALPAEHAVDALVVSAFPDSYTPNPGTLFESLYDRGLDMRQVARHKQEDERAHLGCWLSRPLPQELARRLNFRQIICFEPSHPGFVTNSGIAEGGVEDAVGFVFRCLNNFIIPDHNEQRRFEIGSVAMPLLATGNQLVPLEKMFPRLLEAAIFWLEQGLPVRQLKIVAFTPERVATAQRIFREIRQRHQTPHDAAAQNAASVPADADPDTSFAQAIGQQMMRRCRMHLQQRLLAVASDDEKGLLHSLFARLQSSSPPAAAPRDGEDGLPDAKYDFFISYAHRQGSEVAEFVQALRQAAPEARIFYDRSSIPIGGQWVKSLSDAVQNARSFIAVLSPDYTASPVCWDEFQCAKLQEYNTRRAVIKTVRLYSEQDLPPIMGIYSYIDCAEGDLQRLRASATDVLAEAAPGGT